MVTMVTAVLVLAAGYFVGGSLGDWLFKRTPRGRLIVAGTAVFMGAVLLYFTLAVPVESKGLFLFMLCLMALFIAISSPNMISAVYDITLPEVRSTAAAVQYFIESAGAALAPLMAGVIAGRPVAVITIKQEGVTVEPVVDVTKVALAFFTMLGSIFVMGARIRKASR